MPNAVAIIVQKPAGCHAWTNACSSVNSWPVLSPSTSMTRAAKPGGVLMPVPTAVPPSGSSRTRGSTDSSRSARAWSSWTSFRSEMSVKMAVTDGDSCGSWRKQVVLRPMGKMRPP